MEEKEANNDVMIPCHAMQAQDIETRCFSRSCFVSFFDL